MRKIRGNHLKGDAVICCAIIEEFYEADFNSTEIGAVVGRSNSHITHILSGAYKPSLTLQLALEQARAMHLDKTVPIPAKAPAIDTNEATIIIQLISRELARGNIDKDLLALMTKAAGMIQAEAA